MRYIILLILFVPALNLKAQNNSLYFGMLPEISMRLNLSKDFQFTFKVESMHDLYSMEGKGMEVWQYYYDRTDFQGFIGYKLNPFWSLAGGYQFRLENGGDVSHSLIQQVAYVQGRTGYRLGHRLRTDQQFKRSDKTEFRIRYRFSFELPLQGQEIDPGEFYLVLSDEPIFSIQDKETDLENRLLVKTGYFYNSRHRLETGIDYRIDQFLDNGSRNGVWYKIGWRIRF